MTVVTLQNPLTLGVVVLQGGGAVRGLLDLAAVGLPLGRDRTGWRRRETYMSIHIINNIFLI